MKNPMQKLVDYDNDVKIKYEKTYYCQKNYIIHPNLKSHLKCQNCFNIYDRLIFEAVNEMDRRLKVIFNKYKIT